MGRQASVYALYRGDDFIMDGTIKEIAESEGVTEDTIRFYHSPSYAKRGLRRVIMVDPFVLGDIDKINKATKRLGYTHSDVAKHLNITVDTYRRKRNQNVMFKESELQELEDLFFLDEGELIKGE